MATVFIPAALRELAGGAEELHVPAATVRELIAALDTRFPGMGERLRDGVAVSIDGEIIQDPLLEPIEPESEVHFLPSISGG